MIAIAGGKGGCGKTTTTLGFAAALARQDISSTVVDADADMPDLHLKAGVPGSPNLGDLANGASIQSVVHEATDVPGVSVIPAPQTPPTDGHLHRTLEELAILDGFVSLDCPAGAGPSAVDPLRVASTVILVTTLHPASLHDAAKTGAMAACLDVPIHGVVVTQIPHWAIESGSTDNDGSDAIHSAIARRVERLLGSPIVGTVPSVKAVGRTILEQRSVQQSYDRLASDFRGGECLFT